MPYPASAIVGMVALGVFSVIVMFAIGNCLYFRFCGAANKREFRRRLEKKVAEGYMDDSEHEDQDLPLLNYNLEDSQEEDNQENLDHEEAENNLNHDQPRKSSAGKKNHLAVEMDVNANGDDDVTGPLQFGVNLDKVQEDAEDNQDDPDHDDESLSNSQAHSRSHGQNQKQKQKQKQKKIQSFDVLDNDLEKGFGKGKGKKQGINPNNDIKRKAWQ